ncbi:MAG: YbjN domain-containing protein, partial [Verrucomicrobiota bacterium]
MANSSLYLSVKQAFEKAGWSFAEVAEREVIRAGFEAHHTRVDLHVQVFEKLGTVSVVSESPNLTSDPAKRERLAELAMRVNQTLTVGNFEIDWDDGRLMFRLSNIFSSAEGDLSIIQGLIHNTVGEMDRIAPLESMIHQSEGPTLAGLDIRSLMTRDDLLPPVE